MIGASVAADPRDQQGLPLMTSYSAVELGENAQAWSVTQGPDGTLFIGSMKLATFDGERWRAFSAGSGYAIRGLDFSADGTRLWTAAFNEIGWFGRLADDSWAFHSLAGFLPDGLPAGAHVQQALPGEVLDLPQAEHVDVGVGFLEVQHLPVGPHRLQRAEPVRLAGEHHVQRGQRDMQVLGIHHHHREGHDHCDLGQDEHRLQHAVDPVPQRRQPVPHDLRRERPVRVREHPGVDLRPPVEQQRGDDQEDHPQHDPRGPGMRPEEPRPPPFPVRVVADPDHREGGDPEQHSDGEQVLDEPDERPVPDHRDREGPGEQIPVHLDDRQDQHDEAPERRRMRRPGQRPLQQLALPHHLNRLVLRVLAGMRPDLRHPLGRRLPAEGQPLQPMHPPRRHRQRDHGHHQADHNPRNHANLLDMGILGIARLG